MRLGRVRGGSSQTRPLADSSHMRGDSRSPAAQAPPEASARACAFLGHGAYSSSRGTSVAVQPSKERLEEEDSWPVATLSRVLPATPRPRGKGKSSSQRHTELGMAGDRLSAIMMKAVACVTTSCRYSTI